MSTPTPPPPAPHGSHLYGAPPSGPQQPHHPAPQQHQDPRHPAPQQDPQQSPDQQTPDPAATAGMGGRMISLALLMTATLFTSSATMPWTLLPLALAITSIVLAVQLLIRFGHAGVKGFARAWAVIMLVFAVLSAFFSAGVIALQPIVGPFQKCVADSVTLSGVNECQADYEKQLQRLTQPTR